MLHVQRVEMPGFSCLGIKTPLLAYMLFDGIAFDCGRLSTNLMVDLADGAGKSPVFVPE